MAEDIYVLYISDPNDAPYIGSSYKDESDAITEAVRLVSDHCDDDDADIVTHDTYSSTTVESDNRADRYYVKVQRSQLHR